MKSKIWAVALTGFIITCGLGITAASASASASPSFASVSTFPHNGTISAGETVYVNLTAANGEADLSLVAPCLVNNVDVSSSIQNFGGGSYQVVYTVSAGDTSRAAGTMPIACTFKDPSNNTVTASSFQNSTVAIDASAPVTDVTPPTITLTTPTDGASYTQGQSVLANFNCNDAGGSGIATCAGTTATGSPIDTGSLGNHSFTVTATDTAGNSASTTASYTVTAPVITPPIPTSTTATAFTVTANNNSASYAPGNPATITTTASANGSASNLLLDTEIWSNGQKVSQNFQPLNFPEATTTSFVWSLPAPNVSGTYIVKTGVFQNDWSHMYIWNDDAAEFTVGNGASSNFTATANMTSGTSSHPGITTNVTATADVSNVIIDTEIYDSGNHKIAQNFVSANLNANQELTQSWTDSIPLTLDRYTVKIGVFSGDWNQLYIWNDDAASITVRGSSDQAITIIQPSSNSQVNGIVDVQGLISGLPMNSYNLGWRVDPHGAFTPMFTDGSNSYKHNYIDFSNWNWDPNHQYSLEFQATDASNQVIGDTTVTVNH